jgi:hypothetical protein
LTTPSPEVCLFFLWEHIQVASVFNLLNFKPEKIPNCSTVSRMAFADFTSDSARLSSANCSTLITFFPTLIPLISPFWRIAQAKTSATSKNKYGDSGSPCLTRRPKLKYEDVIPLFIMQFDISD